MATGFALPAELPAAAPRFSLTENGVARYLHERPWLAWFLTRLAGAGLVCSGFVPGLHFIVGTALSGDVLHVYSAAHAHLVDGLVPYRDFRFEYPPGVLLFLYLPGSAHVGQLGFLLVYMAQMLVLDAAVHRLLRRAGGPTARAAADLWLYGGALTAGLMLCRNDLPACLAVVAALLALGSQRTVRAAVLLVVGAVAKVWPIQLAVLLLGTKRRLRGLLTTVGAGTAVLALLAATGTLVGLLRDVGGYNTSRDVEIEAVAALPRVLYGAATGRALRLSYDHGSVNLAGSSLLAQFCTAGCVLVALAALSWVVWRRLRGPVPYESLVLLALWLVAADLVVTKVLSPQYMLWLLAVAAVGVHAGVVTRREQHVVLGIIVATTVAFPLDFAALGQGGLLGVLPAVALLVRDVLLVWLATRWTVAVMRGQRLRV